MNFAPFVTNKPKVHGWLTSSIMSVAGKGHALGPVTPDPSLGRTPDDNDLWR